MNILDAETRARIDVMAQDLHDARARVAELERENERLTNFIDHRGYRRCDVPACNCGSFHGGNAEARLSEIHEALEAAGDMNGVTALSGVRRLIARAESAERELADERAIVNRIWDLFGSPDYKTLGGRSIYDLIQSEIDGRERAEREIARLRSELDETIRQSVLVHKSDKKRIEELKAELAIDRASRAEPKWVKTGDDYRALYLAGWKEVERIYSTTSRFAAWCLLCPPIPPPEEKP